MWGRAGHTWQSPAQVISMFVPGLLSSVLPLLSRGLSLAKTALQHGCNAFWMRRAACGCILRRMTGACQGMMASTYSAKVT